MNTNKTFIEKIAKELLEKCNPDGTFEYQDLIDIAKKYEVTEREVKEELFRLQDKVELMLLKNPIRYKVISPYPGSDSTGVKVGMVIELPSAEWIHADDSYCDEKYFDTFPNNFRKLNWWEDKDPELLPEYLRFKTNGKVRRVFQYRLNLEQVEFVGGRTRTLTADWNPATEYDFINQSAIQLTDVVEKIN